MLLAADKEWRQPLRQDAEGVSRDDGTRTASAATLPGVRMASAADHGSGRQGSAGLKCA
jgi:hypothetical protein